MKRAKSSKPAFRLKRVYDPSAADDGLRVLVDRLWPRGIAKDKIALWLKNVAPSDTLRREFHGDPEAWPRFVAAYGAELLRSPAAEAAQELRELANKGVVTLLYASRDVERNNAAALKAWLDRGH